MHAYTGPAGGERAARFPEPAGTPGVTPAPHSSGLAAPASPPAPPPPGEPPGVSDAAWGGAGGIVGSGAAAAWCPAQVGGGAGACMCGMCGMCGSRQQRSPWPRPIRHSLQQYLHVGVPGVALGCVPLVYRGCAAPLSQPVRMHARMHVCVHTYCLHARTHACMYTCVRACVHVAGVQHAAVAAREAALAHTGPHSPHTQCARTEEITRGYSRRGIHGCDTARTRSRAAGGGVPQTCTRPTHTSAFLDGPPVHPDGPACCDGLPQGPHRGLLTPSEAAIHP